MYFFFEKHKNQVNISYTKGSALKMSENQNINFAPVYADGVDFSFNMYTFTMDLQSVGVNKVLQILGAVKLSPATAKLIHKQLGDCIEQYEKLYGLTIPVYTEEYKRREQEYSQKIKEHELGKRIDSPMYVEPVKVSEIKKEENSAEEQNNNVILEEQKK